VKGPNLQKVKQLREKGERLGETNPVPVGVEKNTRNVVVDEEILLRTDG